MGYTTIYDKSIDSPSSSNSDNGYVNLAIAIITKAANDYRSAYRSNNKQLCTQIRKFFTNSWLSDAFKIDLISIIERIEKEVEEEKINN